MKMSCPQLGTYYIQTECLIKNFKGTVSVISSDPSYKEMKMPDLQRIL